MKYLPMHNFGMKHFVHHHIEAGESAIPADTTIAIHFILQGSGMHRNLAVRSGDVIAMGMNKEPMTGSSQHASVFIAEMDMGLFYRLTGMLPAECAQVILLNDIPFFRHLCELLAQAPESHQAGIAELRLWKLAEQNSYDSSAKLARIQYAASLLSKHQQPDLDAISQELVLSRRQLERDFSLFLGMTPTEYYRIRRFHRSLRYLRSLDPVQAALKSGYCDQAHMTKEYKKLSIWTPTQVLQNFDVDFAHKPVANRLLHGYEGTGY
ncbi:helix-turn-helix domain-containing protein [Gorillibacterium sp. sgz5001074]|uniref:helix-turn-helix domain-containing protein n=1 Tax=Gorillibacterium sp. sgz5001074 TaxID=3446695 RepID=UPI003F67A291